PPAQEELAATVRSAADDQPQRIHALPRSGRGGWTITKWRAKKRAASRALPWCDPPEGPGWSDSGPSPLSAVGGTALPQLPSLMQPARGPCRSRIPRFPMTVNTMEGTPSGSKPPSGLLYDPQVPRVVVMAWAVRFELLEGSARRPVLFQELT